MVWKVYKESYEVQGYITSSGLRRKAPAWRLRFYRVEAALVRGEKMFSVTRQVEVR